MGASEVLGSALGELSPPAPSAAPPKGRVHYRCPISVSIFSPAQEGTECASVAAPEGRRGGGGAGGATSFILREENGNKSGKRKAVWLSGKQQLQLRWSARSLFLERVEESGNRDAWIPGLFSYQDAFSELERPRTCPHPWYVSCSASACVGVRSPVWAAFCDAPSPLG